MSGNWMSINTRRGLRVRTRILAVCASPAVCTTYPLFSRSQRNSFRFNSLSSMTSIGSPGNGSPLSGRLRLRQEGLQFPDQRVGAVLALEDDGVRRRAQAILLSRREVLDGPDDHGRTSTHVHLPEPLEELEAVDA